MRQVVLDTETTGISTQDDHRIIEIGCIAIHDRKIIENDCYHVYLNPNRSIDETAIAVHGLTNDFLEKQPSFDSQKEALLHYLNGDELIIHNAAFDIGFLEYEYHKAKHPINFNKQYSIIDTLLMARSKHPGKKNNLDALCKRYLIDNSTRTLHGALLDAKILAEVYLAMTGGQHVLSLDNSDHATKIMSNNYKNSNLPIIKANSEEQRQHELFLAMLRKKAPDCMWDLNN